MSKKKTVRKPAKKLIKAKVKQVVKKLKAKTSRTKVPRAKVDKAPADVTFDVNPVVDARAEPTVKEQRLNELATILKPKMHPREFADAMNEFKVAMDTNTIIWWG